MTTTYMGAMAQQSRSTALWLLPVPILASLLVAAWLGVPHWSLLSLGAAGWMIALVLRQPVALIASRMTSPERTRTIVGWASGPAEELVRVGLVILFVRTASDAVWAGVGWAGIEVVIVAVNGFVIANLLTRDDPKALKVQAILRERDTMTTGTSGWAVVERCSAIALHVGFTLLLFALPILVLVTMIAHSLTNMIALHYAKRSVVVTELALVVVSFGILLCSLAANRVL
jgi:hypothetical protein